MLASGADEMAHDGGSSIIRIPAALLHEADEKELRQYGFALCRTPLALAARNGHSEVVSLLQVHDQKDATGKTALHLAAERGHLEVVKRLVEGGAKVANSAPRKTTLLHLSVQGRHPELVRWLVTLPAFKKLDLKNSDGDTPLLLACGNLDLEAVSLLLERCADPNLANKSGRLPLQAWVGALRWVKTEPEGPVFSRSWNAEGQRYLVGYPEKELLPGIELLLNAGARPTGLLQAAAGASVNVVKRLLEAGADTTEQDAGGNSPLQLAGLYGRKEIESLLLDRPQPEPAIQEIEDDSRWGPEVTAPVFQEIPKAALSRLSEVCGSPAGRCEEIPGACYARFEVDKSQLDFYALHKEFQAFGCYPFQDGRTERLLLLPTINWAHVVAAMGTNGVNCGIGPGYVIEWLENLYRDTPFILTTVGGDILIGRFEKKLKKASQWAEKMYHFCPDIVDQGVGSVEALAQELRSGRELYFWWD